MPVTCTFRATARSKAVTEPRTFRAQGAPAGAPANSSPPPTPSCSAVVLCLSAYKSTARAPHHCHFVAEWGHDSAAVVRQARQACSRHAPRLRCDKSARHRPLLRTCEPLAIAVPVALDRPADIFAPCAPTDARHRSRARRLQCNTRREVRETLLGAPTGQASPPSSANAVKRHSQAQRWRAACALCRLRSAGASARVRSFFSS